MSWNEFAVIGLALALGGLLKGITGLGLPLIAVPVMAGFIGVERAVMTMVIPSIVLNAYQVWVHRDEREAIPEAPRLLIAGAAGAILGAAVLNVASDRALATGLASWIVAYFILRVLHPRFALTLTARMRLSPVVGGASGALQGATGISAPIIAAYVDSLRLTPRAYVLAVCAPFCVFAMTHCIFLLSIGAYSTELLLQSCLAIVPALLFIPIGARVRGVVSAKYFDWIVRLTLLAMSVRLLYSAWVVGAD